MTSGRLRTQFVVDASAVLVTIFGAVSQRHIATFLSFGVLKAGGVITRGSCRSRIEFAHITFSTFPKFQVGTTGIIGVGRTKGGHNSHTVFSHRIRLANSRLAGTRRHIFLEGAGYSLIYIAARILRVFFAKCIDNCDATRRIVTCGTSRTITGGCGRNTRILTIFVWRGAFGQCFSTTTIRALHGK